MENLPTSVTFFAKTRCREYRCQWPGLIQRGGICVDEGLTLQTAASLSFHCRNLTLTNLFDTKFSCFIYPPTRLHSSPFLSLFFAFCKCRCTKGYSQNDTYLSIFLTRNSRVSVQRRMRSHHFTCDRKRSKGKYYRARHL